MGKKIILGGVLGGLVMFLWGAVSWIVLPWHDITLNTFTDEAAVADAVISNAPRDGVYVLPDPGEAAAEKDAAAITAAPFLFVNVSRQGVDPQNPWLYIRSLLTQIIAATLITLLLVQTRGLRFWCRVGFVETIGILVAVLATLPMWNWWQFPARYTLVNFADLVIAAILAGLVIAKVVGDIPEQSPPTD